MPVVTPVDPCIPAFRLEVELRDVGVRITRWHITPFQADLLEARTGQRDRLLGYPVKEDR